MNFDTSGSALESVGKQLGGLGIGALSGGLSKHAIPLTQRATNGAAPQTALQVGSAMGAAVANGAGLSGTVAAGVGVITGKAVLVAAATTAAAPVVATVAVFGAIGYALWKVFK